MYLNFLRFIPSSKCYHFLYNCLYFTVFCFILNGMLVRMIFMVLSYSNTFPTKKPLQIRNKELGTYRFLLLTLIFADMINALIHLVILPVGYYNFSSHILIISDSRIIQKCLHTGSSQLVDFEVTNCRMWP